jgi:magnesium chelatase family protein
LLSSVITTDPFAPNQRYCQLEQADINLLSAAIDRLGLSARSVHRILKVARTIADLVGSEAIQLPHLAEAISYRRLERVGH